MIYIYHRSPLLANGILNCLIQSGHFDSSRLRCINLWNQLTEVEKDVRLLISGRTSFDDEEMLGQFRAIKTGNPEMYILFLVNWIDPKFIKKLFTERLIDGVICQTSEISYFNTAVHSVLSHQVFIDEKIDLSKNKNEYSSYSVAPQDQRLIDSLTAREKEIMHLVMQGKSSTLIGEQLYLSPFTVKTHRKNILHKLGANNTFELINFLQSINYSH